MEHSTDPGGVLGRHAVALRAALLQPFLRLNFATLWVRDQEWSRRFFVEKLNFEPIVDVQLPRRPVDRCRSAGCWLAPWNGRHGPARDRPRCSTRGIRGAPTHRPKHRIELSYRRRA